MSERTEIVGRRDAATLPEAVAGHAIAASPTTAMMPVGRKVFVRVRLRGEQDGQLMGAGGVLVAFNDDWLCLETPDGHRRLIAVSEITSITTDPNDRPKPRAYLFGTEEEIWNGTAKRLGGRR